MALGPKPRPAAERFWAKVEKTDGCWNWTGATSAGYGRLLLREPRRLGLAHRFAYELLIGPIPDGLVLDHLCRNRRCVNPQHLEPVDNRTNVLRGVGTFAQKARQTHCLRGHEFTPENTLVSRGTGRGCRECARQRTNTRRQAAREASR